MEYLRESCGIFGVYGHREASRLTWLGLYALQHRGDEGAGIVSGDGRTLYQRKGMGLVAEVFPGPEALEPLKGHLAIGHTRYSTTGASVLTNVQPFVANCKGELLAIAHNGNLTNTYTLRRWLEQTGSLFQTTMDSEVIVHLAARSDEDSTVERIVDALGRVRGAFSLLFATRRQVIAVRDPYGFRPLSLGRLDGAWVVASETCALDLMGRST